MSNVILSVSPYPSGMRAQGYWGPLHLERVIVGKSWEEGIDELLEEAAQAARDLSCNAVVNIEISCDPYHQDGGKVWITGTIASLEPWFCGAQAHP